MWDVNCVNGMIGYKDLGVILETLRLNALANG